MISAICPQCGTDDVEYVGTDADTEDDEYICCDCQNTFVVNWEELEEENPNAYPDKYYKDDFGLDYENEEEEEELY